MLFKYEADQREQNKWVRYSFAVLVQCEEEGEDALVEGVNSCNTKVENSVIMPLEVTGFVSWREEGQVSALIKEL